jgi:monoamine oxidase
MDNLKSATPSRRRFLELVGKIGGSAAVYETMTALGLLNTPKAWAGPAKIARGSGAGKTVAILGAGLSGLSAAYELQQAGYNCVILELLERAGGRNFTARRGTRFVEDAGPNGRTEQVCDFDEGLYLNLGPGRLPYHHHRTMHYCKEFDIPLEVYVLSTTANLFQTDDAFNSVAQPRYRIASDTNSHISELLGKAIDVHALDGELTQEDSEKFKALLAGFGGTSLGIGSGEAPRNGCVSPMAVEALCKANPRLPLRELLASQFWDHLFYQPDEREWQATLFQPVGGMDKIVDAFVKRLHKPIRFNSDVLRIENQPEGVVVRYRDRKTGKIQSLSADYCLSNIPLPKLAKLNVNFSDDFKSAVEHAKPGALYKLGWQANRRFWEEEPYNIYGGISYTSSRITQMWYPSHGYMGKKGIIAGSYAYHEDAEIFGRMTLTQRIAAARRDAVKLHKEFADETLIPGSKAVSIAWNQIEGQSGGHTLWDLNDLNDRRAYQRLLAPDSRFFVIGDQISPLSGWQEGAFMSSEHAVRQICGTVPLGETSLGSNMAIFTHPV